MEKILKIIFKKMGDSILLYVIYIVMLLITITSYISFGSFTYTMQNNVTNLSDATLSETTINSSDCKNQITQLQNLKTSLINSNLVAALMIGINAALLFIIGIEFMSSITGSVQLTSSGSNLIS